MSEFIAGIIIGFVGGFVSAGINIAHRLWKLKEQVAALKQKIGKFLS